MAEIQKGFNTQVEELKVNLANIINNAKLPAVTIESILQELTIQATSVKMQILRQEKEQYDQLVADNVDKTTSK